MDKRSDSEQLSRIYIKVFQVGIETTTCSAETKSLATAPNRSSKENDIIVLQFLFYINNDDKIFCNI